MYLPGINHIRVRYTDFPLASNSTKASWNLDVRNGWRITKRGDVTSAGASVFWSSFHLSGCSAPSTSPWHTPVCHGTFFFSVQNNLGSDIPNWFRSVIPFTTQTRELRHLHRFSLPQVIHWMASGWAELRATARGFWPLVLTLQVAPGKCWECFVVVSLCLEAPEPLIGAGRASCQHHSCN